MKAGEKIRGKLDGQILECIYEFFAAGSGGSAPESTGECSGCAEKRTGLRARHAAQRKQTDLLELVGAGVVR